LLDKPQIIAHRGGSHYAPENTIEAAMYTQLINASIDEQLWVTSYNTTWLDQTEATAPDMITALSLELAEYVTVEEFQAMGYDMINTHHSKKDSFFRDFAEAGIPVNVRTVNIASRFQQVWTLGVTSVTTDKPEVFLDITKQLF